MSTTSLAQSVQVKVTLPFQLQQFAQDKAQKYGLSLSTYIKHLVIDDVREMHMPTFPMSEKTEKVATQALEDHKQGKTHQIDSIDAFLNSL